MLDDAVDDGSNAEASLFLRAFWGGLIGRAEVSGTLVVSLADDASPAAVAAAPAMSLGAYFLGRPAKAEEGPERPMWVMADSDYLYFCPNSTGMPVSLMAPPGTAPPATPAATGPPPPVDLTSLAALELDRCSCSAIVHLEATLLNRPRHLQEYRGSSRAQR